MSLYFVENIKNTSHIKFGKVKNIDNVSLVKTGEWKLIGSFNCHEYENIDILKNIREYFVSKKLENGIYSVGKKDVSDLIYLINLGFLFKSVNMESINKDELVEFTEAKNIEQKLKMINDILKN